MKKQLTILLFLLGFYIGFTQETNYKEYSYIEFFQLIEAETDSVFKLEHAIITFDSIRDTKHSFYGQESIFDRGRTDTIFVRKEIYLNDVHFPSNISSQQDNPYGLHHISFEKKVRIKDTYVFRILNSTFKEHFEISFINRDPERYLVFRNELNHRGVSWLVDNVMLKGFSIVSNFEQEENSAFVNDNPNRFKQYYIQILIQRNSISNSSNIRGERTDFSIHNLSTCYIKDNHFIGTKEVNFRISKTWGFDIENNVFDMRVGLSIMSLNEDTHFSIVENTFKNYVLIDIPKLPNLVEFEWEQFQNKLIHDDTYYINYSYRNYEETRNYSLEFAFSDSEIKNYLEHYRIENVQAYRTETNLRNNLYQFYKSKYQIDNANGAYRELKDLQTENLKYQYKQNPSFESFFTWRINQFLKVFSAYGTKPAKAVVFSMYVILLFAFIYLLFPNSWDAHGRKRIMNRYAFFFTYINGQFLGPSFQQVFYVVSIL